MTNSHPASYTVRGNSDGPVAYWANPGLAVRQMRIAAYGSARRSEANCQRQGNKGTLSYGRRAMLACCPTIRQTHLNAANSGSLPLVAEAVKATANPTIRR